MKIGEVANKYEDYGGTNSYLRFPTGDSETTASDCGYSGDHQAFEGGKIYSSEKGTFEFGYSPTLQKYFDFGEMNSILCYPQAKSDNYLEFEQGEVKDGNLYGIRNDGKSDDEFIDASEEYLCDASTVLPNFTADGVDRIVVCSSLGSYVTKTYFVNALGSYAAFCSATTGSCVGAGNLSALELGIDDSFATTNIDYVASELIHEGQHANWSQNNKGDSLLANEFNSHKLQGLYILEARGNFYDDISGIGDASLFMSAKEMQLLDCVNNVCSIKTDGGAAGLYNAVCNRPGYFHGVSDDEKACCFWEYGVNHPGYVAPTDPTTGGRPLTLTCP